MLGRSNVSFGLALGLGRYFTVSPQFRLNPQSEYDLSISVQGEAGGVD